MGRLPRGRQFRLLVSGGLNKDDLRKMIRLLEVQSELLDDGDESETPEGD